MSYLPRAQFQRLLAKAYDAPDDIAWGVDVVDPGNDVGTKVITRRLAVSSPCALSRAKRDVQHADVKWLTAAVEAAAAI